MLLSLLALGVTAAISAALAASTTGLAQVLALVLFASTSLLVAAVAILVSLAGASVEASQDPRAVRDS